MKLFHETEICFRKQLSGSVQRFMKQFQGCFTCMVTTLVGWSVGRTWRLSLAGLLLLDVVYDSVLLDTVAAEDYFRAVS